MGYSIARLLLSLDPELPSAQVKGGFQKYRSIFALVPWQRPTTNWPPGWVSASELAPTDWPLRSKHFVLSNVSKWPQPAH